jgi:sigma-B regulation protein RsbU (phosphoserine phosphatase)
MAADNIYSLLTNIPSTNQGITNAWRFHPSTELSGDIFNFFPLDETHVGFYILDVAGHGIAAAIKSNGIFVTMQSFTLSRISSPDTRYNHLPSNSPMLPDRRTSKMAISAPAVVTRLNQQFQTDADNILYFTITYGVINTQDRTIDLCQAGHPHALYLKQGKPAEFIADSNLPVGIMPDTSYESVSLKYDSGDRLFLYSDGITECESPSGEMFGIERLRLFIEENRHLTISEVIQKLDDRIRSWRVVKDFEDDISMLILEL